ncbi:MAG: signal peptidase II [Acidobacteriota bacterium]
MRDRISVLLIAAAILLADQASKWLLAASLSLNARFSLLDGVLALNHVRNRGAAFGLFADVPSPMLRWVLVVVSVGAVALIWAYAREDWHQPGIVIAFGAILGGALGNLVDRLRLGYVIDFVDVHWGPYHWPSFNLADTAITLGAITLFLTMAGQHHEEAGSPHLGEGLVSVQEYPGTEATAGSPQAVNRGAAEDSAEPT